MTLSATDFLERLQQDRLDESMSTTWVGMAKMSEGKGRTFQFAPGLHCSGWVAIPLELVEEVEVLRKVTCKDHSHPLVSLRLKAPRTPEGKVFFALLEGMHSAAVARPSPVAMPRPALGGPRSSAYGPMAIESGCRKVCGPAICPNPTGPGTIWCTECWIECRDVPEFGNPLGFFE
jgi:hypothetical protein